MDDLDPEARVRQERIIAVSRPVIILVHPGSLGGSFISANEFHPGWKAYAIEQRAILLTEFQYHAGRRIVVRGGMVDDEADQVPEIREAVACADERRRAAPEPAALRNAAMLMLQRHPATHEFLVTGAWADPGDGCAWEIYRVLRDLAPEGTRVKLSQYAAKADVPEARITSGCTPLLGNTTTRVRWHVLHDSAAYGKNKESMRYWSERDARWNALAQRLLRIGGAVVCACPEEDMGLILRRGRTWTPQQADIILTKGKGSRCHQNTLFLKESNPHLMACAGWSLSRDGIWRQHSWCVEPGDWRIIETTAKRLAYHGAALSEESFKERLLEAIL